MQEKPEGVIKEGEIINASILLWISMKLVCLFIYYLCDDDDDDDQKILQIYGFRPGSSPGWGKMLLCVMFACFLCAHMGLLPTPESNDMRYKWIG